MQMKINEKFQKLRVPSPLGTPLASPMIPAKEVGATQKKNINGSSSTHNIHLTTQKNQRFNHKCELGRKHDVSTISIEGKPKTKGVPKLKCLTISKN